MGKNATDIALVIDAMELLYTQKPEAFCLVSSDADFTPLVMQLKANGHDVYGFGERKTPLPFVNACTTFLYLDTLDGGTDRPVAVEASSAVVGGDAIPVPDSTDDQPAAARRPLSQDTKLVTILRGAVEASAHDDGWAAMSAAGSAAKRQASIDPRNYGARNFAALFAATGLFEITKVEDGQPFVADKRNRDRSPKPIR